MFIGVRKQYPQNSEIFESDENKVECSEAGNSSFHLTLND